MGMMKDVGNETNTTHHNIHGGWDRPRAGKYRVLHVRGRLFVFALKLERQGGNDSRRGGDRGDVPVAVRDDSRKRQSETTVYLLN